MPKEKDAKALPVLNFLSLPVLRLLPLMCRSYLRKEDQFHPRSFKKGSTSIGEERHGTSDVGKPRFSENGAFQHMPVDIYQMLQIANTCIYNVT